MGMLSRQTTSWTEATALKMGVALVLVSTSQSNARMVRPQLKTFLKMIMQVNPSMAKSPEAGVSRYLR
jgi:hypothetical protein